MFQTGIKTRLTLRQSDILPLTSQHKWRNFNVYILRIRNRLPKCHVLLNIGLVSLVFANGLRSWGSIQGRVIPKTQEMVLDTSLLNPQYYMVQIKGKVEQYSGCPWLRSPTLLLYIWSRWHEEIIPVKIANCQSVRGPFRKKCIPFIFPKTVTRKGRKRTGFLL